MDIKPKTLSNNLLTIAFLFFLSGIISLTNVQPILAEYTSLKKSLCSNRNLETLSSSFLPRYIAHQGCVSKHYHGNTLEAIYESLHHPVAGIEIDIRLSKDHVPFLFHDDTLGESTNGSGKPEKYTWSQLQKLSYTTPEKERIPSLEEVLRLIEYRKFSFLDIKTSHFRNAPFVKQLAKLIYKYHLQNTVVIESLNPFFLKSMRMKAPDIRLMYDFMIDSKAIGEEIQAQFDKMPWLLKQPIIQKQIRRLVRPNLLGPRWNIDKKRLQSLARSGRPVVCWTVDDPQIAADLFSVGVTAVQTNQTDLLMEDYNLALSPLRDR